MKVLLPNAEELAREWHGQCLELVNELLHDHPAGAILYVEPPLGEPWLNSIYGPWKYHAVLLLDGLVYDAWHPQVRLPPGAYVERVFGPDARWEINPGSDEDDDEIPAVTVTTVDVDLRTLVRKGEGAFVFPVPS